MSYTKDQFQVILAPSISFYAGKYCFAPLNAFDALLYAGDTPLATLANEMVTFYCMVKSTKESYFNTAIAWNGNTKVSKELYNAATGGNLVLRVEDNDLSLRPLNVMGDSEVLFYVSDDPKFSKEFVVGQDYDFKGKSMYEVLMRNRMQDIFGPLTIKVFESIGYNPASTDYFEVSVTYGSAMYDPNEAIFHSTVSKGSKMQTINYDSSSQPSVNPSSTINVPPLFGNLNLYGNDEPSMPEALISDSRINLAVAANEAGSDHNGQKLQNPNWPMLDSPVAPSKRRKTSKEQYKPK